MKLGLGLYRRMLTSANLRFARQAGATHIVAHLVDYFKEGPRLPAARIDGDGWGVTQNQGVLWTIDELRSLRSMVEGEGLELAAIENLDPSHWHDVLLDGPRKLEQLEDVKTIVRRLGEAGIPCLGYNFSLAGVWGWTRGPYARGGAESVGFHATERPPDAPIPNGMIWNMTYDPDAAPGTVPEVAADELWSRLTEFLEAIVPVAEEAGVRLAAHPDDPPVPTLRGTARLLTHPDDLQRLLEIVPSRSNALEFCQGVISEMAETDVYETIDRFAADDRIAYVHFRNVRGKVPHYDEMFLDDGDVDMLRALRLYRRNGYDGVLIPDHTPQMSCDAPWHAGMAYALGHMRALLHVVESE